MTPGAGQISVSQTLALLDGAFLPVANGVAEDRYALWLDRGISLGKVDGLRKIIPRALEHLRSRIDPLNAACKFRPSLDAALALANLSAEELGRSEFGKPVAQWPDIEVIRTRLSSTYSLFLNVYVEGEERDYLLWSGVDVRTTYADPTIEPDVEHLCIAILILEGVASEIPSANWDGLVEKAVILLSGAQGCVVCVRGEDLQLPKGAAQLYKFHGCAVKARADEATYRKHLVARQPQIARWLVKISRFVIGSLASLEASRHSCWASPPKTQTSRVCSRRRKVPILGHGLVSLRASYFPRTSLEACRTSYSKDLSWRRNRCESTSDALGGAYQGICEPTFDGPCASRVGSEAQQVDRLNARPFPCCFAE